MMRIIVVFIHFWIVSLLSVNVASAGELERFSLKDGMSSELSELEMILMDTALLLQEYSMEGQNFAFGFEFNSTKGGKSYETFHEAEKALSHLFETYRFRGDDGDFSRRKFQGIMTIVNTACAKDMFDQKLSKETFMMVEGFVKKANLLNERTNGLILMLDALTSAGVYSQECLESFVYFDDAKQ